MVDDVLQTTDPKTIRYDEVRQLLKTHFQQLLQKKIEQIAENGRLSAVDRTAYQHSVAFAEDAIGGSYPLEPWENDDTKVMSRAMAKFGLDFVPGSTAYVWMNSELKRAHRDFAKAVLAYDSSLDHYVLTSEGHSVSASPISDQSETKNPALSTYVSLDTLTRDFVQERSIAGQWAAKTKAEKLDHIALLIEMLGAKTDAHALSFKDTKFVKDSLIAYPKNRSKNPATRGKSLADALAVEHVEKIQIKTVNKYLQTYSDIFEWARQNNHVGTNIFSGLRIKQRKSTSDNFRESFSDNQISRIIDFILSDDNTVVDNPYRKWGTLIGIYTGARLNEICQLHLSDIRRIDGTWCFDLNDDGEDKHLKAVASKRRVPMHPRLIELGLPDHVQHLRDGGNTKLFPNFTYCIKNGWGRQLGRWFNDRLLPDLGLKSRGHVFHSLRHTVVTKLTQSGVPNEIVKALVGHSQKGVTLQVYFKTGYTMPQLSDAISQLRFTNPQTVTHQ